MSQTVREHMQGLRLKAKPFSVMGFSLLSA